MKISKNNYRLLVNELEAIIEKSDRLRSSEIDSLAILVSDASTLIAPYDVNRSSVLMIEADKLKNLQEYRKGEYQRLFDEGTFVLALNVGGFIKSLEILDLFSGKTVLILTKTLCSQPKSL